MGLRLFFLPNFPAATFIQGATFIPDSRVWISIFEIIVLLIVLLRSVKGQLNFERTFFLPSNLPKTQLC